MADLSYLVMTAADASAWNTTNPHDIVSLNQLLEERSNSSPDQVCVGFIEKDQHDKLVCKTSTFKQLYDKVCKTAHLLHTQPDYAFQARESKQDSENGNEGHFVVGLLAPSCEEFLVTLFALFRLGWSVLLIAPQNTAEDIAGLCKTTGVTRLLYHPSMRAAASKAGVASKGSLEAIPTLLYSPTEHQVPANYEETRSKLSPLEERETDCIVFHSSGSSGTPKPIPQKHRIWTKAACCKPYSPSFTTTPLFHGGISDLLRSMMSKSTLYMFPSTLPITASNLLQAFHSCPVQPTSFLSVPYILEMLADTQEGMMKLASFELVSTGGSPLAQHLGDAFVQKGVKLVSRYGSSESGFLMTSFRHFDNDIEWNYLRPSAGKAWLTFEDQGDGSYELIVPKEWPTRNKSNRPDGSFATSDLFRKHSTIEDAWMLCGRSDDVILMSNGEKASPAPLEIAIRKNSLVKDALVFGVNRSSLGVAVIPAREGVTSQDLTEAINEANKIAPAHAQIAPELVVILSTNDTFPKASKGTIQRGKAYEAYATTIDNAYKQYEASDTANGASVKLQLAPSELLEYILDRIRETVQMQEVEPDDDLFNLGLSSTQALRVRNLLKTKLDLGKNATLPPNIVYECSTARRLAKYITNRRQGLDAEDEDADLELMKELIDGPLANFESTPARQSNGADRKSPQRTCVLTGGTGSLGAQLIAALLNRSEEWKIMCLVRSDSDESARKRVLDTLEKHHIKLTAKQLGRLSCLAAKLPEPSLGLRPEAYDNLAHTVDLVIHAAWPVHFSAGLQSFVPHLQGLRNLIDLARSNQAQFFFCSSTSAVLAGPSKTIQETFYRDPTDAVAIGYARSKFVAESICASAWNACGKQNVGVLRLGQLSGDTAHGIWKTEDGWPQLFASADFVGCLPDLDEVLNWLPMDKAAEAILDITTASNEAENDSSPVFQVTSTSHTTTYRDAISIAESAGLKFELVPPTAWLAKLQAARDSGTEHCCLKMLPTWERNYSRTAKETSDPLAFETSNAERYTQALATPTTESAFLRILRYWQEQGLINLVERN